MSHFPDLDTEDIMVTTTTTTTSASDFLARERELLGDDVDFVTGSTSLGDFNDFATSKPPASSSSILASDLGAFMGPTSQVAKFNSEFPSVEAISPVQRCKV
jgi:hypothetical protein